MSFRPSPAPDLTVAPALLPRAVGGFGTSILAGIVLGSLAWAADQLDYPIGTLLAANAIGAWLALAFALGASARTIPTGALRGLIGLLSAVAGYYALTGLFGTGFRSIGASHAATIWGAVALGAGPLLGLAGSTWRRGHGGPRILAVALLAAMLVAEGLAFQPRLFTDLGGWFAGFDASSLVLTVEALIGLATPGVMLRGDERRAGYAATIAIGAVGAVMVGPIVALIRATADRF